MILEPSPASLLTPCRGDSMDRDAIRANLTKHLHLPERHPGGPLHPPPRQSQGRGRLCLPKLCGHGLCAPAPDLYLPGGGSEQYHRRGRKPRRLLYPGGPLRHRGRHPRGRRQRQRRGRAPGGGPPGPEPGAASSPGPSSASPAKSPRPSSPPTWAPGFTPNRPASNKPRSWACSAWRWWDITPRPPAASRSPCPCGSWATPPPATSSAW